MRVPPFFILALGLWMPMACLGRSALEAYELGGDPASDDDGSGGAGGATVSSSGTSMSTSMQTTTTTMPQTVSTIQSSSSGTMVCDMSGDCGLCVQCAFEGPCQAVWQECFNSQPCVEMLNCIEVCGGPGMGCFPECAQGNPIGAQEYLFALQCMVCDECPNDCAGQTPPQLCN